MFASLLQVFRTPRPSARPTPDWLRRIESGHPAEMSEDGGWFTSSLELRQGLFVQDLGVEADRPDWAEQALAA